MKLSKHFNLEEFTRSETATRLNINNSPTPKVIDNLKRLAITLEQVRTLCKGYVIITSGYRSIALNTTIGGSRYSQHINGCAADFYVLQNSGRLDLKEVMDLIIASDIEYDQLIYEFGSWIHLSVPNIKGDKPRKQALTIDSQGTRPYIPR